MKKGSGNRRVDGDSSDTTVGGIATPPKNMKVNWDDYSQYVEK